MVVIAMRLQGLYALAERHARAFMRAMLYRPHVLLLVGVILLSSLSYTAGVLLNEARYHLTDRSQQLIGKVNHNLAKKVSLDQRLGAYRFNAGVITPEMTNESDPAKVAALLASQKQQTGGGGADTKNLYALDLSIDPKKGTTVYDTNSKTSFKIVPEFAMDNGRSEDGRVVYPLQRGGQAVYTVKGNGIKEDIVLTKPRGNALNFRYKLELPKSLVARLDDRGNLGIYGVDPTIASAAAQTMGGDPARIHDIMENGSKDHLIYLVPAPTIAQSGINAHAHSAKAMYHLEGNQLTVEAVGLEKLTYPITIDPSVVVTSTSDFATGDNEGMIQFDTDAISRAPFSGGAATAWTATTSLPAAVAANFAIAYNGYMYNVGELSDGIQYAPINADGSLGAWTAATSYSPTRFAPTVTAYGGYLYVLGGSSYSSVLYAPMKPDGSLGPWTTTTSFTTARQYAGAAAYNGYMYISGGSQSFTYYNDVQYAPINADGSLGAWTTTTSFTTARDEHGFVIYNGYAYIAAGYNGNDMNDVQYAPINADGSLGAWTATTSFTNSRFAPGLVALNGYLYVYGGSTYNDTQYAPINADGSLGAWTATTSFTTGRNGFGATAYNGRLYLIGGFVSGAHSADVQFATITSMPGTTATAGSWAATTILGAGSGSQTAKATTRKDHTSVAYNGYVYIIGGMAGTTPTATVHYAPTNANGTLGAWTASAQPLPVARYGHASVIVDDYIYVIGGTVSGAASNTILYSQISATGANGAWTTAATTGIAATDIAAASYNGYIYVTGGGASGSTAVYYSQIGTNGAPGTWTATTSLPVTSRLSSSTAYNGYLYVLAGYLGGATNSGVYYAPINANGTVGTWATTTSATGGVTDANAVVVEGYMILDGGSDGFANTGYVIQAKINSNGTLGSWTTPSMAFSGKRTSNGLATNNGYLYVTGGVDGATVYGDTQYEAITLTRGGPSATGTTATWQSATATNLAVYGQSAVVYNGYVYLVGGYGASIYRNDVRYAPIANNGTIGTWTTATSTMGLARFNAAAVAYKGYLYVTGGQQAASTFTNTTEYAPINSDGSLGTWVTSSNTFTTARYGHVAGAYNGKLYVVGGGDAANAPLGDVKYATINADGSLGTWSDTTAMLTSVAARDTDGFIYGGRLYILGGVNGSTYLNAVRYATINADGTLGKWTVSPYQFASPRSRIAVAAVNGYIYLSGGGATNPLGDLQYAPINADGTTGAWKTSNNITTVAGAPAGYYYHSMVAYRGKLYSFAGMDGAAVSQSASYVTTLNAPALSAMYSQSINIGQSVTLNSLVMNGTLPVDQSNVYFRTAGTNGVYGAWRLPSTLVGTPLANVRYVQCKLLLDDSTASDVFSSAGRSSVTDVTLDYSFPAYTGPAPDIRLRHNKYFDASGVLQPMETP